MAPHEDDHSNGVLVVIPTYNEIDNLEPVVGRLRSAVPEADVLIVDDGSPDGTGRLADDLAREDGQIHVLHRARKTGLGAAYLEGFDWGLERRYGVIVEMDADGSHRPEQLPALLDALAHCDAAFGSRWVSGGVVLNRSALRTVISRCGTAYARLLLGIRIRDVTGGYRAYRSSALRALDLADVESIGYCFQIDLAWRAQERGLRVVEVPIELAERERGASKMSRAVFAESLTRVTRWGVRHRLHALRKHGERLTGSATSRSR